MDNCVCVNYFTRLQDHLSQIINTFMSMQSNINLPSTDSGVVSNDPLQRNDPQGGLIDGFTFDSMIYLIMIIIGLFLLYSAGLRRRHPNKSNITKK